MILKGNIVKMRTEYDNPIKYFLSVGEKEIFLNNYINKNISLTFLDKINCINCGADTKKSFHQGYCYSCFVSIPQTDSGVLNPEKDLSHKGISRDMEWSKKNSLIDHFVYIALTGDIKVGVTRHTQVPFRWIDQGAIQAIRFAKTPYRQLAGEIEVELKKYISDKTNWNKMLLANNTDIDLVEKKNYVKSLLPEKYHQYISLDNRITKIKYPFENNGRIDKFSSVSLDVIPNISGKLIGIKGQYLIFENGNVINIRKHNGYLIEFKAND